MKSFHIPTQRLIKGCQLAAGHTQRRQLVSGMLAADGANDRRISTPSAFVKAEASLALSSEHADESFGR